MFISLQFGIKYPVYFIPEGLNKFSSVIPTKVRNIIKAEVIRLTSLTDASADNSDFAHFPVLKFKHFGVSMKLDKVGQEILLRETSRYSDRYTVGVFEAVMNSDHYQSHVKQEQQKKKKGGGLTWL